MNDILTAVQNGELAFEIKLMVSLSGGGNG